MIFKLLEDHGRRYLCYFIPFPSLEEVILDSLADVMSIAEKTFSITSCLFSERHFFSILPSTVFIQNKHS